MSHYLLLTSVGLILGGLIYFLETIDAKSVKSYNVTLEIYFLQMLVDNS